MNLELDRSISWHKTFMDIAKTMSKMSTCSRLQVGSVLVRDKRILSHGINGVPAGQKHCKDIFYTQYKEYGNCSFKTWMSIDFNKEAHAIFSKKFEIHSEMNCLLYCARNGINTENSTLYVTHSPCMDCSKSLIAAGISTVIYDITYDRESEGLEVLKAQGIEVIEFSSLIEG